MVHWSGWALDQATQAARAAEHLKGLPGTRKETENASLGTTAARPLPTGLGTAGIDAGTNIVGTQLWQKTLWLA